MLTTGALDTANIVDVMTYVHLLAPDAENAGHNATNIPRYHLGFQVTSRQGP